MHKYLGHFDKISKSATMIFFILKPIIIEIDTYNFLFMYNFEWFLDCYVPKPYNFKPYIMGLRFCIGLGDNTMYTLQSTVFPTEHVRLVILFERVCKFLFVHTANMSI